MTDNLQEQIDNIQEHLNRIGAKQMDIIAYLEKVLEDKSVLHDAHKQALSKI